MYRHKEDTQQQQQRYEIHGELLQFWIVAPV